MRGIKLRILRVVVICCCCRLIACCWVFCLFLFDVVVLGVLFVLGFVLFVCLGFFFGGGGGGLG